MELFVDKTAREIGFDRVSDEIKPVSEPGRNYKKNFEPFVPGDEKKLQKELNRLEDLIAALETTPGLLEDLQNTLQGLKDLNPLLSSITEATVFDQFELFEIKKLLVKSEKIFQILKEQNLAFFEFRKDEVIELLQMLSTGGSRNTFVISDSYSRPLRKIRQERRAVEEKIRHLCNEAWSEVEELTGFKVPVTGEFIISRLEKEKIERLHNHPLVGVKRQNVGHITFQLFDPPEVNQLKVVLAKLKKEETREEKKILKDISLLVFESKDVLRETCASLGYVDFLVAKAEYCLRNKLKKPDLCSDKGTYIINGRHLVVEDRLKAGGFEFQPVSFYLLRGVTLLTGTNMGGKTVCLKLAGLLVAMFQYGLFVPCEKFQSQLYDFIFFSCNRDETLSSGLSIFGREVRGLAEVLKYKGEGLLLLDELAHGTNPPEAVAFCRAFIEAVRNRNLVIFLTTHYPSLAAVKNIKHFQVRGVKEDKLEELSRKISSGFSRPEDLLKVMDFTVKEAGKGEDIPKNALLIARALGFPGEIIDRAESILHSKKEGTGHGQASS